jgi:hypothetical protein
VATHGWPGETLVGPAAAHAVWLLVQHAPHDFQEECLPLLEDAVARGDASPRDLAYLTDRVLMFRGEPQVYGTQYQVRDGQLALWTVRERRRPGRAPHRARARTRAGEPGPDHGGRGANGRGHRR